MNGLMRFFFVAVLCSVAASLRPAAAAEPLQTLRKDHPAAAPVDAAKLAAIPRGGGAAQHYPHHRRRYGAGGD